MNRGLNGVVCPACRHPLDLAVESIACGGCGQRYPRVSGIPVLLPQPDAHIALWRGQLGLLLERGEKTFMGLNDAADAEGLSSLTRERLLALGTAVRDQVDDIAQQLGPALGGRASAATSGLPRGVVEYIAYLYRDWGWPAVGYRENERALSQLAKLMEGRRLGRTLLLGAGACGLAYDLHRLHGASETVALDIDPYLLVIGAKLVRGEALRLTEASLKVMEVEDVSRAWRLIAPAGPLDPQAFHCVFADGLAPPFADESFDSVVTPWFIDQVPRNLPAFLAELARLLVPGGWWLNQGPLIYPEQTPFEARASRDELFDLAEAAGFEVGAWSRASLPYLVSPLSGTGRVESVLSFVAARR
jgi:uncharacterized protein YbaR (Trm112 family)/ubiquinone/menaquinone biosynthesis C-methylase UbiE